MNHDDAHSERKWKIEAAMLEGKSVPRWPEIMNTEQDKEEYERSLGLGEKMELRKALCALEVPLSAWTPLDAGLDDNMIRRAREKLLTTDDLRRAYVRELSDYVPELASALTRSSLTKLEWALTQSTHEQQARAILAAIKP